MFQTSIIRFLIASLAVLMTGLFIAALILAIQAWQHYALAGHIARLTDTDRQIFNALVMVRAQVPKSSTALIAEDDPRPVMDAARELASQSLARALAALQSTDLANHHELAAAVRTAWIKSESLQTLLNDEAARARPSRNLHDIDGWRDAIHETTDALSTASAAVGNAVRIGDPLIAEMVQIRRTSWTIRDRYGLQCSMLRANVDTSEPLTAAQVDAWLGNRATYMAAWHTLDEYLLRPGVSSAVQQRIDAARNQTQRAQAEINAVVARFGGDAKPAMQGAEWTALCDGPFDAILGIAQQAQEEANVRAEAMRAAAFRTLMLSGSALAAVIVFGAFCLLTIQRRLTVPMRVLIATIARLSRREFDEPVASTDRPDELGRMAQALETLRASALEAQRLQIAMSRFTADASHQMRTPLSVLRTHISVLNGIIPPGGEAYASLKDIEDAADRLQRLLIQLLKLARADSGQPQSANAETIDLRRIVQEIAAEHAPQASEAQLDLHFECENRSFPTAANAIVLKEILTNLIDNAIRYNGTGGSVVIRLSEEAGRYIVEVEDDGPGIPETEYDKVFTRFYRMNRDQSRSGSGLGLAIVQSFVTSLNAQISLTAGANARGLRVRVAFLSP
jgi:two-component system, sensor histidine kinase